MKSMIKNKKGDLTGSIYLIAMVSAFAFFILIAGYIGDTVSTEMRDTINSTDDRINQAFDTTINTSRNTLSVLWFVVFGGLLLSLLVTAWFIPSEPIFVPIFIILLVVAVIVGVAMSNTYEALYDVTQFSDIASTQSAVQFIMVQLPYVALITGLLSLVITFAKPGGTSIA